jgi:ABC-type Fe3+-siderophore transport system permease subunit
MQQQEDNPSKDPTFINIKKLAALDVVFHGPKVILTEFGLTVGLCSLLMAFSLSFFIRSSSHPLFSLLLSLIFLGIALNYVPLLLYGLHFVRYKNAGLEVEFELAHKERYARKYQLQSFLLFIPFVVSILALVQKQQKHGH